MLQLATPQRHTCMRPDPDHERVGHDRDRHNLWHRCGECRFDLTELQLAKGGIPARLKRSARDSLLIASTLLLCRARYAQSACNIRQESVAVITEHRRPGGLARKAREELKAPLAQLGYILQCPVQ